MSKTTKSPERFRVYWNLTMHEMESMGIGSLLIVVIISGFLGAVSTVQTAYQLTSGLIPKYVIGSVVCTTGLLELSPTITSIVLAGRIGSSITSQLGTMRVTEQIDALEVMGINSASYLILPKIFGALFVFPMLVAISAFVLNLGGVVVGDISGAVTAAEYMQGAREYFEPFQARFMLYKATTFGFIISTISAYQGYYVQGGALEVGQASTRGMVYSCIMILLADYLLAQILL